MRSRAGRTGLVRLITVAVAGGALVGAAAGTEVVLGPRTAGPAEPGAPGAGVVRYLTDVRLACPGVLQEEPADSDQGEGPADVSVDEPVGDDGRPGRMAGTWLRGATAVEELRAQASVPAVPAGSVLLEQVGPDGIERGTSATDQDAGLVEAEVGPERWATLTARGGLAPGLVGAQLTYVPGAGARGLALTACSTPTDVVHLVGGGGGAGRVELLVVTNPSTDPVTIDVDVLDEGGPAQVVGGAGLVVPAQGRLVRRLDALAPGAAGPVVRVTAQGGPVAAHLTDRHRQGTTDLGREVVAAAAIPARDLVVPALLVPEEGGEPSVTLRLAAPDDAAVVEIRALPASGAPVLATRVVRVPAGGTLDVALEGPAGSATGLRLRADEPVTAGALLQVAPVSEEPIVLEEELTTAAPDDASRTSPPDAAATTSGADSEVTTTGPDAAAGTTEPVRDGATPGPELTGPTARREPVLRPAGDSAWVAAVPVSAAPLGLAVPSLGGLPQEAGLPGPAVALAVSAVGATTARVLWLDEDGRVRTEDLVLGNDSTQVLRAGPGVAAVWVVPTGQDGVVAALHVSAQDVVGPYLASATLPSVPWTMEVPTVVPVLP